MIKGMVSVIVPVYNVKPYLRKCLDSILAQTYQNIEIIVVDDGSTDGSSEICDEYAAANKILSVFHKKNGGLSSARNYGLDRIQGEYVGFVDSDDYIHPQMYELLVQPLEMKITDCVSAGYVECYEEIEGFPLYEKSAVHYYDIDIDEINNEFFRLIPDKIGISVWRKAYRSSIFTNIRFVDGCVAEDLIALPEILKSIRKITILDKDIYYYRQSNASIIRSPFSKKNLDFLYARKAYLNPYLEKFSNSKNCDIAYEEYIRLYLHDYFYNIRHKCGVSIPKEYYYYFRKLVIHQKKFRLTGGGRAGIMYAISLVNMRLAYYFALVFAKFEIQQ